VTEALKLYPIKVKSIEFVRQSDNTIYRILDNENTAYCLRLHKSINTALDDDWKNETALASEMIWTHTLSVESDLTVTTPYKNNMDKFLTTIEGVICTLVKWLNGEHKLAIKTQADSICVGKMIGNLHKHSSQWKIPEDFNRPSYDMSSISAAIKKLEESDIKFDEKNFDIFKNAAQKIINTLNSFEKTNKT